MVHNTLGPTPTSYYPFKPSSSESFKLMHTFSSAHTYNITVSLNLEQCPHYLISYHGNATFCTTVIEMIKPFFSLASWHLKITLPCDAHLALEHSRGNGVFVLFYFSFPPTYAALIFWSNRLLLPPVGSTLVSMKLPPCWNSRDTSFQIWRGPACVSARNSSKHW